MNMNDNYIKFCEDFTLYLGCVINYKTELVYYRFENDTAIVYISINDHTNELTKEKIQDICKDFKINEDLKAYELNIDEVFKYNGIIDIDNSEIGVTFSITEHVLNRYRFSENLITSLTVKNKFNL